MARRRILFVVVRQSVMRRISMKKKDKSGNCKFFIIFGMGLFLKRTANPQRRRTLNDWARENFLKPPSARTNGEDFENRYGGTQTCGGSAEDL